MGSGRGVFRVAWLLGVALLVPACGSGGDDAAAPSNLNGLFSGVYGGFEITGAYSPDSDAVTSMTITADGAGNATATGRTRNTDGAITTPADNAGPYTIGLDRSFSAGTVFGALSPSGTLGVTHEMTPGDDPALLVMVKRASTTVTDADLNAQTYFVVALARTAANTHESWTGTLTFSNTTIPGTFSGTVTRNIDGVITAGVAVAGDYAYTGLGQLSLITSAGETLSGRLRDGHDFGAATSTTAPRILLLVKRSGAFTTASASGSYWFVMWDDLTPVHATYFGVLNTDGLGSFMETSSSANIQNTVSPSTTLSAGTYTVAADGTVVPSYTGGATLSGGMLFGGEVAIFAPVSAGAAPGISLLLKK